MIPDCCHTSTIRVIMIFIFEDICHISLITTYKRDQHARWQFCQWFCLLHSIANILRMLNSCHWCCYLHSQRLQGTSVNYHLLIYRCNLWTFTLLAARSCSGYLSLMFCSNHRIFPLMSCQRSWSSLATRILSKYNDIFQVMDCHTTTWAIEPWISVCQAIHRPDQGICWS